MTEQNTDTEINTSIKTKDLQIFSMMQAFSSAGYQLMRTDKGGLVFFCERAHRGKNLLALEGAIRIYNNYELSKRFFDAYALEQFQAAKVVKRIKLQYSKKTKQIIHQNDMVKFVKPEYEEMFLYLDEEV